MTEKLMVKWRGSENEFMPLQDRVLVRMLSGDELSDGGIVLVEELKETKFAEVVAMGHCVSKKDENGGVREGDIVYANDFQGMDLDFVGSSTKYKLIKATEIFGKLKGARAE